MYSMAIDAGTGSVRAVIFDLEGNELAAYSKDWDHVPVEGVPGSMDFDTAGGYLAILEVAEGALAESAIDRSKLVGVSATSMREAIVCLDSAGREVWACANVDARATKEVRALREEEGLERRIYEISGQTLALAAQPRLLWLKRNMPAVYAGVTTVLMLSEWVLYKLSGEYACEPSNASTSGLLNLATRQPDDLLLTMCDLKPSLLPKARESGTRIGSVRPEIAEKLGIEPDVAVSLGGGDTQMAALGAAVVDAGQGLIVGGTFWQEAVNIPAPTTDPEMRVRINCAAEHGMWWAEAIAFHVGTSLRWFRDTFAGLEAVEAVQTGVDTFQLLDERAARVPIGSYDIVPIFSDTMNYKAWRHAAPSFLNLPIHRSGDEVRAGMYRALLENAAIVSSLNMEMVAEFSGVTLDSIVLAGGGAKSPVWAQIVADVSDLRVDVPVVKETTAAGAALCAFVGAGAFASVREAARAWSRIDYQALPNKSNHEQYKDVTERWQKAYAPQLVLADNGTTESLWRAPGT